MKFFHLADLHLGKCIHGYSMIEMGDQPFWMDQLIKKAEEIKPDAVVIAGDVYDRAVPSKEAVALFDRFLTKLSMMNIPVLIIAGNHDSGTRLAFGDKLLCRQGIYLAGEPQKDVCKVTMKDSFGNVHFWLLPYLFPSAVQVILNREDIKDYDTAMKALLEEQNINLADRNVLVSHQFVTVGTEKPVMGGSETTVGGIGQIDGSAFEEFDYVALGHIHNAQKMGRSKIRYAGSPLPYHFSEAGQSKGLTIVELNEKGNMNVTVEKLPMLHQMCEVSGTMEDILNTKLENISYVRVLIKQEFLPAQAVDTIRTYFEAQGCILMEAVRDYSVGKKGKDPSDTVDVEKLSLEELFSNFYGYLHQGNILEKSLEKLVSFAAEQSRNCRDETEQERGEAARQLVKYALHCKEEEKV